MNNVPNSFNSFNIISKAEDDIGSGGISGFMASAVIFLVKECHKRGNEFYKSSKSEL